MGGKGEIVEIESRGSKNTRKLCQREQANIEIRNAQTDKKYEKISSFIKSKPKLTKKIREHIFILMNNDYISIFKKNY